MKITLRLLREEELTEGEHLYSGVLLESSKPPDTEVPFRGSFRAAVALLGGSVRAAGDALTSVEMVRMEVTPPRVFKIEKDLLAALKESDEAAYRYLNLAVEGAAPRLEAPPGHLPLRVGNGFSLTCPETGNTTNVAYVVTTGALLVRGPGNEHEKYIPLVLHSPQGGVEGPKDADAVTTFMQKLYAQVVRGEVLVLVRISDLLRTKADRFFVTVPPAAQEAWVPRDALTKEDANG